MGTAELVIRGATVLDGSGGDGFAADVAVRDGRIDQVGSAGGAAREVDGAGLTLAPGFVDTHTHDDGALLTQPGMEFKLAQGITTVVIGNCGFSAAPHAPGAPGLFSDLAAQWTDLAGYFDAFRSVRPAVNAVALIGHNTLRSLALGGARRPPEPGELARMRDAVEHAMEQGACGLSTGLIYRPGRYAATEEVIELARPVGARGGLYATHMRNEADALLDAVDETLRIGRESGCAVHISHHKAAGRSNWGRVAESLAKIDRANAEGADVTLDVYPYTAGSGPMAEYFDPDRVDPERARVLRIARCPAFPDYEGRMVTDIADSESRTPEDVVRRILTAPRGDATICIHFIIDEADVERNLRHPRMMIGSDGIPDVAGKPHPRLYGTMPRVLGRYVRERGVLSLPEAVRRMTRLSCERFGLLGRGRIAEGYHADLVLFDPARVRDTATYDDPRREPEGVRLVVINGRVAYENGAHTGAGAGRPIGYRRETDA